MILGRESWVGDQGIIPSNNRWRSPSYSHHILLSHYNPPVLLKDCKEQSSEIEQRNQTFFSLNDNINLTIKKTTGVVIRRKSIIFSNLSVLGQNLFVLIIGCFR